jgi:hypothetical protein
MCQISWSTGTAVVVLVHAQLHCSKLVWSRVIGQAASHRLFATGGFFSESFKFPCQYTFRATPSSSGGWTKPFGNQFYRNITTHYRQQTAIRVTINTAKLFYTGLKVGTKYFSETLASTYTSIQSHNPRENWIFTQFEGDSKTVSLKQHLRQHLWDRQESFIWTKSLWNVNKNCIISPLHLLCTTFL